MATSARSSRTPSPDPCLDRIRHLIQLLNGHAHGPFHALLAAGASRDPDLARIAWAAAQYGAGGRRSLRSPCLGPYLRHRLFALLWERSAADTAPDTADRAQARIANLVAVLDRGAPSHFYHELMRCALGDGRGPLRRLLDQHDRALFELEGVVEYDAAVAQTVAHGQTRTRAALLGLLGRGRRRLRFYCADYRLLIGLTLSLSFLILKQIGVHYWNATYYDCAQSGRATSTSPPTSTTSWW